MSVQRVPIELVRSTERADDLFQLAGLQTKEHLLELRAALADDFDHDAFIDSSGLATLIEGLQAVGKFGVKLRLCGLAPAVRNLFKLSNLISIFDIRETREDATK